MSGHTPWRFLRKKSQNPPVTRYVPAHQVCVPEHGPNIPACFFTLLPLPVISAGAYGRADVEQVYTVAIHQSRS